MLDFAVPTHVHALNEHARLFKQSGVYPWNPPHPPESAPGSALRMCQPFHSCAYCGSIHPAEVAHALENGADIAWADWKYGWPHKAYLMNAPNPYYGQMEIYSIEYRDSLQIPGPESPIGLASGQFYTLHLDDTVDDDLEVIEQALGLHFTFEQGSVHWKPIS